MKYKALTSSWLKGLLAAGCLCCGYLAFAQNTDQNRALAQQFAQGREYDKAIPIYKQLYAQAPFDKNIYDEYLQALLGAKQYDSAETLVNYMARIRREDASVYIDLGNVYDLAGKKSKAKESYDKAADMVSGDAYQLDNVAGAFTRLGKYDYAIKIYEQAQQNALPPDNYDMQLAGLYAKQGDNKKALEYLLDVAATRPDKLEDVKTSLLSITGQDARLKNEIQKQLIGKIKQQPGNPALNQLQNWLYTQSGQYDKALQESIGLDKKLKEQGERVYYFAQLAEKDDKNDIALKALDYILSKGKDGSLYRQALFEKISLQTSLLQHTFPVDEKLLSAVLANYRDLFNDFPQYAVQQPMRSYAGLQALFAHDIDTAITILNQLISTPGLPLPFVGNCKLDLGDYYILEGKVWDASLVYSQVDKEFKEDMLGEDARFRNAKLAYYRGDFKWAQSQLNVLKASTTELIANDALYLSVLITENTPADSNIAPLLGFARADLLLFQNKTKESDRLLDSIAKADHKNPLQDDILMLRSKIAEKETRYNDAIGYLQAILDKYADDVLADDAVYHLALIYRDKIKDKKQALIYFEKLITDYPGSSYVQQARQAYNELKKEDI